MKKFIALTVFVTWSSFAPGAQNQFQINIMLIEENPWLMVVGSDSPTFALYESGQAIWRRNGNGDTGEYRSTELEQELQAELNSRTLSISNLNRYYKLSEWTDQPTQVIYYREGSNLERVIVYGRLRNDPDVREKAPKSLVNLFDRLANFKHPKSLPWKPKFIEVMIWPYEYAPEDSIIWPVEWPDINDKNTKTRGDSYSIYLPVEYEDKFNSFIQTRNEKGAVLINNRKWAVSTRVPFPHEFESK